MGSGCGRACVLCVGGACVCVCFIDVQFLSDYDKYEMCVMIHFTD